MQKGKVGLWMVVIFVVVLLSTALYVAINGYDKWKGDMKTAVTYSMAAGTTTPQTLPPVPEQKKSVVTKQAGQFVCPVHGATGLPDYDINGKAVCPVCGREMSATYFK
ncbi:MAG: hypothetical protein HQM15_08375 [Deltaproteobacteria bacterium]|nr:hypothetical protein [Deltaproteobacteria bacterium]